MTFTPAQIRTLSWTGLALGLAWLVWTLGAVLAPFLLAAVLAYMLQPAVDALHRRRVPRALAVGLVETLALVTLLAVLLLIVPILAREIPLMRDKLPELIQRANDAIVPWLSRWGLRSSLDVASLKAFLVKHLSANADDIVGTTLSSLKIGGSFVFALIGNAVLVPVVLFYLLMDWHALVRRVQALVPPRMRAVVDGFLEECDHTLGQYLRGQLLVMVLLAIYYTSGLALAGFELAVPVGVFTGLAVFVPYVGFGLGLLMALLAAALQFGSWGGFIAVAVVYGIGQVVESIFLTPRLVGERIGLHPIVVIFALLAFGQMLGFVGVLIALPASAVGAVAFRRLVDQYRSSRMYLG